MITALVEGKSDSRARAGQMATGGSQTGFAPVRSLDCVWTLSGRDAVSLRL